MPPTPPSPGAAAPDFRLESHLGDTVQLSGLRGRPVVVYFYPKDNTPGCTLEAQQFQKLLPQFEERGAVVLGISPDPIAAHCRFAGKYGLNFRLLADPEHQTAEAYGVWTQKSLFGRKYMGVQRSTFLIDAEGNIARAWEKVRVPGHAKQVLAAVRELVDMD